MNQTAAAHTASVTAIVTGLLTTKTTSAVGASTMTAYRMKRNSAIGALRNLLSAEPSANDRMHDVIATPRPQPVFKPTYKFEPAMNAPRKLPTTNDRSVNCGTSPRYVLRNQSTSGSPLSLTFFSAVASAVISSSLKPELDRPC